MVGGPAASPAIGGPGPASPMAGAPARLGPGVQPQPNPGNAVLGMSKVRQAISLLESALPDVPMGMELHTEIMNATKALLKHINQGNENPQIDMHTLVQHLRGAAQQNPMQALQRAFPGAGGAGGGSPALPPGGMTQ